MNLRIYDPRILAIDLRHRRFGYAVYEGHKQLLDWGIRTYPAVGDMEAAMAGKRVAELVKLFSPSTIVVKNERWEKAQTDPNIRVVTTAILFEASLHAIPIRLVEGKDVRATFRNFGCETRDDIATALARIFPELVWDLPTKRRTWESQNPGMTIFDAIALGLAYWQHPSVEVPALPDS